MNITFFVGNGFDINLGLKTRYTDFYPYYLSKGHNDLLSNAISKDFGNWADLELELGKCLAQLGVASLPEFLDSKTTLEKDLVEYLDLESKRISFINQNIMTEFQGKVVDFYKEFSEQDKMDYQAWCRAAQDSINYQFVTFNYTTILDQIIAQAKKLVPFSTHKAPANYTHHDRLSKLIHIHGTLENDTILGINDPSQIGNPDLREQNEITDYLVKSSINELLGNQRTRQVQELINDSVYVCVYGMSLGDTDSLWWEYIFQWLISKPSHRLVLYIFDEISVPSGPEKLRKIRYWQNIFFKKVHAPGPVTLEVRKRIIVLIKSQIFNFENICLKGEPDEQT